MDQETHDAAVRTVSNVARELAAEGWEMPYAIMNTLALRLDGLVSPPAKPEAKLEAFEPDIPDADMWRKIVDMRDGPYRYSYHVLALAKAVVAGTVKIVDERGKGAEAERLAPCPVCGKEPSYYPAADGAGRYFCAGRDGHSCYGPTTQSDRSGKAWNACFERAERFPGER